MDKLKLLEWSLNLSSSTEIEPHYIVIEQIANVKPDVIFLMETVKTNEVKLNGFKKVVESDNQEGNTVSIYIAEDLIQNAEIKIKEKCGRLPEVPFCNSPNFTQVYIEINGVVFNLIAYRARVSDSSYYDYLERRKQFDYFMEYVAKHVFENLIIMGDFNNGNIRGKATDCSLKVIEENKGYAQIDARYFYQRIREDFEEENLKLITPKKGYSHGLDCKQIELALCNKQSSLNNYGYLKSDHLVVSKDFNIDYIDYNWNFINLALESIYAKKAGYMADSFLETNRNGKKRIKRGFPDHAMLVAEIKL